MSLQVWLPLLGNLENKGLYPVTATAGSNISVSQNGKLGPCYIGTTSSSNTISVSFLDLETMLANGKQYTLACWVKPTENTSSISSGAWVVRFGTNQCGLWWGKSNPRWVWNENDNGKRIADEGVADDFNNWHHITVTVDKSVEGYITTKYYADGFPSPPNYTNTWSNSGHSQPAGSVITIYPYYVNVCDVRLYDHLLTQKEIKELANALIFHCKFDNDNDVYDCSGYNHPLELDGTIEYNNNSARYSKSIDFKGTGCAKSVPFYYDSNIWSISFWYYEPTNPTDWECMFAFSKGDGTSSNKKITAMPNSGQIAYQCESGSKNVYSLVLAEWTFLTITCDGTAVKIYQNATQIDSFNAGTAYTGCEDFVIGKRAASSGAATTSVPYKGRMSDFRMYATCLTENDILELYQSTASGDRSGNLYIREAKEVDTFDTIKARRNGRMEGDEFTEHTNNLVSMKETGSVNSFYLYEY